MTTSSPSFQLNNQPSELWSSSFMSTRGMPAKSDQNSQHKVAQIFEVSVPRKELALFGKRYLVQQVLHKPERAKPAANKTAEKRSDKHQETDHVERKPLSLFSKHGLESAHGASSHCSRA